MSTEMIGMQSLAARAIAETKAETEQRYLGFGNFTVDLKREELFKDGARIRLPGKVYQTLVALLDRPGEVVSREDLRSRLWPEGTHVNYDANVNTTVNKLRLALGDSPEKPIYVETIPRKGYCFLGNVERGNELLKTFGVLTIVAADGVDGLAAQQGPLSIISRKIIRGRFAALFANGWAILLCGVLIGVA